jgi:hypothetical protein
VNWIEEPRTGAERCRRCGRTLKATDPPPFATPPRPPPFDGDTYLLEADDGPLRVSDETRRWIASGRWGSDRGRSWGQEAVGCTVALGASFAGIVTTIAVSDGVASMSWEDVIFAGVVSIVGAAMGAPIVVLGGRCWVVRFAAAKGEFALDLFPSIAGWRSVLDEQRATLAKLRLQRPKRHGKVLAVVQWPDGQRSTLVRDADGGSILRLRDDAVVRFLPFEEDGVMRWRVSFDDKRRVVERRVALALGVLLAMTDRRPRRGVT